MEAALIFKLVTLGADLVERGAKAYMESRDTFSTEDQAVMDAALGKVYSDNDMKAKLALAALDAAST